MSQAKKSRKGKVMKETAAHRKAQLHKKRQNPTFRKHENKSKEEVTFAITYMTKTMNEEPRENLLKENADILVRMGGLEGLHEFLFFLEALKDDWQTRINDQGLLRSNSLSPSGIDFALQNEEDQLKYV